jgi:hypothetical protein
MNNVIFTTICQEHGRPVERSVWLMSYSIENLRKLWEKSSEHRILFSDDVNGDFHKFCSVFLSQDHYGNISSNGLLWVVDDFVGILFMSDIQTREALLHFSFFDGRLRFDISKEMISYIFDTYEFDRLNAEIVPFASKRLLGIWERDEQGRIVCVKEGFLDTLGFKKEGSKRKAMLYKNERYDLFLYGLLREEFEEKWDTKKRQLEEVQLKV